MDGQPLTFTPAGRGYRFEGQVATGKLVGMALGRDPLPKGASPAGMAPFTVVRGGLNQAA